MMAAEPLAVEAEVPKCRCGATAVAQTINGQWVCGPCRWLLPYWDRCPECYQNYQQKTRHINLDNGSGLNLRTCLECEVTWYEADAGHFVEWSRGR